MGIAWLGPILSGILLSTGLLTTDKKLPPGQTLEFWGFTLGLGLFLGFAGIYCMRTNATTERLLSHELENIEKQNAG